jgi:ankyrin repeat protein
LVSVGWSAPSGEDLLRALKDGDAAVIKRQIAQGAPANAIDEFGSSALMYAAAYSDVAVLRTLLDHGADPNHADNAGATALMWAIPNEAKIRLLLERGARVNATSQLTGRTPLLIAAGRPGAAGVVRLLLEKGADPKARDIRGENTIFRAAFSGDTDILRLLVDKGADVNGRTSDSITALMEAAVHGNSRMIEILLARDADTRAHDEEGYTALTSAVSYHDFTPFRLLISKGADPTYRSMSGQDLLMAAASSDTSRTEVIRELVNLPVDLKIRSANFHTSHGFAKDPESPLDWASRHGDTPVARLLAERSGDQPRLDPPDESPRLKATTPRAAIEKALPLLYAGGAEFFKRSGCTSCHHNMLPSLAFSHARAIGIVVDEEKVRRNYLQSVAWIKGRQEMLYQDVRFPGADTTASYLLWGLEADGHKRDRATDAVVHHLSSAQAIDGGWRARSDRPPIESGSVTPTALSIHALRVYPIPGRKAEFDGRVRRAATWLSGYHARTGEEKAMRLLGLTWAGASSRSIRDAAAQLAAAQRPDGGWAQLDTLPSDAYATGQALYALHTAGQLRDQALQKGVRFLLDNQLADGSWHVRSRSYPIQSLYFDTGFPHGRDQWISAAGTSWACIALSLAIER